MKKAFAAGCCALLGAAFPFGASALEIVAHRGEMNLAPQNSVEAVRKAWQNGVKSVEADFYKLPNGEIICIHAQQELKKFTGSDKTIDELTAEDLAVLDLANNDMWRAQYSNVRIPTLLDILKTVPKDGVLHLEIKGWRKGFGQKLEEYRKLCGLEKSNIIITSFNANYIKDTLEEAGGGYRTMLIYSVKKGDEDGLGEIVAQLLEKCKKLGVTGICFGHSRLVDAKLVKAFRDEGFYFNAWPVRNMEELKRLESIGVQCITTDFPAKIVKLYAQSKAESE